MVRTLGVNCPNCDVSILVYVSDTDDIDEDRTNLRPYGTQHV